MLSKVVEAQVAEIDTQIDSLYGTDAQSGPSANRRRELEARRGQLRQLPILRLKLASDPPAAVIARVQAWVKQNIPIEVGLQIDTDPRLVAGAQISWAGKFADLSKQVILERVLDTGYERFYQRLK